MISLEFEPHDANANGNYAKNLILERKKIQAKKYITKAFEYNKGIENDLTIELWFYCYAIFPKDYPESKNKIEELLSKGIRSLDWDFKGILEIAKKEKHPEYEQLIALEKRITAV